MAKPGASQQQLDITNAEAQYSIDDGRQVAEVTHAALHDKVPTEIVGGDVSELPRGYYMTPAFLGTFKVRCWCNQHHRSTRRTV